MGDILIDREKECTKIVDLINQSRNIIIFGSEGVGKTVILNKVLSGLTGLSRLFSSESRTLKGALINLLAGDFRDKKALEDKNLLALKKIFYGVLSKEKPKYVIFDHIEEIEGKFYSFLVYLMEAKVSLILISRSLENKGAGYLFLSSFNFEKVEISNMDRTAADALIEYFIKEFGIKISQTEEFKKKIFHFSQGNPKVIKELCSLAKEVRYQKSEGLDVKLMDLDRRISIVTKTSFK